MVLMLRNGIAYGRKIIGLRGTPTYNNSIAFLEPNRCTKRFDIGVYTRRNKRPCFPSYYFSSTIFICLCLFSYNIVHQ